jgi:nicotinic acetylcholine receptor, invertebrate
MMIQQTDNKNVTKLTHLAYNTEWQVYDTCAINKTIKTSVDLEWWVTSYVIEIKRESIYYFYTLIMPCGVLSSCSLLLFWLPPDSEEKITLGVTILLAFFVNSLVVSNYTPESASTLPVIGVYYTFSIFVVALSLAGSVFISSSFKSCR